MERYEKRLLYMGIWMLAGIIMIFLNLWAGLAWIVGGLLRPDTDREVEGLAENVLLRKN